MGSLAAGGHRRGGLDTLSPCLTSNASGRWRTRLRVPLRLLSLSKSARPRRCGDAGGQRARCTVGHRSPCPATRTVAPRGSGGRSPRKARRQERRPSLRSSLAPSLIHERVLLARRPFPSRNRQRSPATPARPGAMPPQRGATSASGASPTSSSPPPFVGRASRELKQPAIVSSST